MGTANPAPLSWPHPGFMLSLDFPVKPCIGAFFDLVLVSKVRRFALYCAVEQLPDRNRWNMQESNTTVIPVVPQ